MLKARDRDSPKAQVGFLLGHSGVYAVHAVISRDIGDAQETNENLSAFTAIKVASLICISGQKQNFRSDSGSSVHGVQRATRERRTAGRPGRLRVRRAVAATTVRRGLRSTAVRRRPRRDLPRHDQHRKEILSSRQITQSPHVPRERPPNLISLRDLSHFLFQYHGTEYLGAAHGVCTILQMLLSVPASVSAAEDLSAVKSSVDYLLSIQVRMAIFFQPCHSELNEIHM